MRTLAPIQFEAFDDRTGAVLRVGTMRQCSNTARKTPGPIFCRRMEPMKPEDIGMSWAVAIYTGMAQPIERNRYTGQDIYTL